MLKIATVAPHMETLRAIAAAGTLTEQQVPLGGEAASAFAFVYHRAREGPSAASVPGRDAYRLLHDRRRDRRGLLERKCSPGVGGMHARFARAMTAAVRAVTWRSHAMPSNACSPSPSRAHRQRPPRSLRSWARLPARASASTSATCSSSSDRKG